MPNPIPFSVAAAQRNGNTTFVSPTMTQPSPGYSLMYWEFVIPIVAEYENPANQIVAKLLINGVDAQSVFNGGQRTDKQGNPDPPSAVQYDISGVPAGATFQVEIDVNPGQPTNHRMTVGIQNGLLS